MYWKIKLAYLFSTWVQYNSSSSEHIALKLKLFLDIQVITTSILRYTHYQCISSLCISHPVLLIFVSSNNFYTLKRFVNHCDKVFPAIWFILYLLQLSESAKMGQGEGEGAGSGKGNENLVMYHNHNVILLTRQLGSSFALFSSGLEYYLVPHPVVRGLLCGRVLRQFLHSSHYLPSMFSWS